jgi:hypothetical protein
MKRCGPNLGLALGTIRSPIANGIWQMAKGVKPLNTPNTRKGESQEAEAECRPRIDLDIRILKQQSVNF